MTNIEKFDAPKAIESVKIRISKYSGLKITGMNDKDGYEKVRIAISECVSTRTEFVANCKEARQESTRYSKFVIDQEKIGVEEIKKIEDELRAEKEKIDSEKQRIKEEKEAKEKQALQSRIDKLSEYGYSHDIFDLQIMEDVKFQELLSIKKETWEASELLRKAQEENERKEREEFEKQKKEMEAKQKEMQEREDAIARTEKELEDKKIAQELSEQMESIRKEAEEKSRIETEIRMKREQEEKEQKEAQDRFNKRAYEKLEQEKIEKKKKYQVWVKENFVEGDEIRKTEDGKVIIWRKISEFLI